MIANEYNIIPLFLNKSLQTIPNGHLNYSTYLTKPVKRQSCGNHKLSTQITCQGSTLRHLTTP